MTCNKKNVLFAEIILTRLRAITYTLLISLFLFILQEPIQLFAQESGSVYLRKGIKRYEEWDISGAIINLRQALSVGLNKKEERIEAYKLLGMCYAENGDQDKSVDTFRSLLKIAPDFQLGLDPSPTYAVPFAKAKGKVPGEKIVDLEPPQLTDLTVGPVLEGKTLQIIIKAHDEGGVARVVIAYKNGDDLEYTKSDMKETEEGVYEFTIPEARRPWVEYAIAAFDNAGNRKILEGKSGSTQVVEVTKKKGGSKTLLWLGMIGLSGGGTALYFYLQKGKKTKNPVKLMEPPPMPGGE